MLKLGENYIPGTIEPWVQSYRLPLVSKYKCGHDTIPYVRECKSGLNFWRVLCNINSYGFGHWNLQAIPNCAPNQIVNRISAMVPPSPSNGPDFGNSQMEFFLSKSAYESICARKWRQRDSMYHLIWSWPGPERCKIILWKIVRNDLLLTNDLRCSRHLISHLWCPAEVEFRLYDYQTDKKLFSVSILTLHLPLLVGWQLVLVCWKISLLQNQTLRW